MNGVQFSFSVHWTELNWMKSIFWTLNLEQKNRKKYLVQFTVHKGSQSAKIPPKKNKKIFKNSIIFLFIYRRKPDIPCKLNWVFERNFEQSKKMNGELMNKVHTYWTWTDELKYFLERQQACATVIFKLMAYFYIFRPILLGYIWLLCPVVSFSIHRPHSARRNA